MWFRPAEPVRSRVPFAAAAVRRRRRLPPGARFALDAALGATLMVLVHLFVIQVSVVKGTSMEPCLHDGDRLVVDRVSYNVADVGRGDVVILRYPRNPDVDFVKRIVALPGDRVAMQAGVLFVNGAPADDYGCIPDHQALAELTVPPAHFFVLGDNRPVSCDSRDFGLVDESLLKGRVRARFWPLASLALF
jgi:signal peptidase I